MIYKCSVRSFLKYRSFNFLKARRFAFLKSSCLGVIGCVLFFAVSATAEIYKSVDKNGKVTYTDVPSEGAKSEVVDVKKPLILPSAPKVYFPSNNQNYQSTVNYEIAITNPTSGVELAPEDRSLTIDVNLNPGLAEGMSLSYKVDGAQVANSTEMQFVLNEPPRGEHQLTVDVVDEKGEVLAKSEPVTFVVMRPLFKAKVPPKKGKK